MKPETEKQQPLPVGVSDFKEMREGCYYFVDNSLFIQEIIEAWAKVLLIPRPRRFGKTLNLSMLRYFFEKTEENRTGLFEGLHIRDNKLFETHYGQYPVIYLTFKDIRDVTWDDAFEGLKGLIIEEIERHQDVFSRIKTPGTAMILKKLKDATKDKTSKRVFEDSLRYLSKLLDIAYGKGAVILIDEYDTPLYAGYNGGYYEEVVNFMRNFFSGGLKDNPHLFKGVITGVLRVAKESIFSGLNNLGVYTLLDNKFTESFGFTEQEVKNLLKKYGIQDKYKDVSKWYNGYLFGNQVIYNPWSVISCIDNQGEPKPYWINTADTAFIDRLATRGGKELREELGQLTEGAAITRPVYETIVMRDLDKRDDLLWSFLLFSGYLKSNGHAVHRNMYNLAIPNKEVKVAYEEMIIRWFSEKIQTSQLIEMIQYLEAGNIPMFGHILQIIVRQIMSFHDLSGEPEKVYHALVLGMLVWMSGKYEIRSNRESGYGRYDVLLKPKDPKDRGIIIEFKKIHAKGKKAHEKVLKEALEQIEKRGYATELEASGITEILKIAVAFRGKELWTDYTS